MDQLVARNYDNCLKQMVLSLPDGTTVNNDTLKQGLETLNKLLVNNFTQQLEYSFVRAESQVAYTTSGKKGGNETQVFLQFSNKREFGIMQFTYDDKTGKILTVRILDVKQPIPATMGYFWLLLGVGVVVLAFNIYALVLVKRSQVIKKWQKYLLILLANAPTLSYNVLYGFSVKILSLQLLGLAFGAMGYAGTYISICLPLGSMYVLWKLKNGLYTTTQDIEDRKRLEEQYNNPTPEPDAEPPATAV
jgi:hypothetical protein